MICTYESLADCLASARMPAPDASAPASERRPANARPEIELLLVNAPTLHAGTPAELRQAANALGADQVALVYGYGAEGDCEAALAAGIAVQHSPISDVALGEWLRALSDRSASGRASLEAESPLLDFALFEQAVPTLRRYDDTTLSDIAGLCSNASWRRVPAPRGRTVDAVVALRGLQRRMLVAQPRRCRFASLLAARHGRRSRHL
jgi:hypothetical protein